MTHWTLKSRGEVWFIHSRWLVLRQYILNHIGASSRAAQSVSAAAGDCGARNLQRFRERKRRRRSMGQSSILIGRRRRF
jgi:hypothetical protein